MFDRADAIAARLKAPLRLVLALLLAWAGVEALLYRSGAYYRLAEPQSNTGAVVNARLLLAREYRADARNVLVFGDSRVGEGFSPKLAEAGDERINFVNVSVPGSTPRTWWYLLRAIADDGYRFDAVVVGALYQPRDQQAIADWPLDPMHAAPLLGLRDLRDYPAGFPSEAMRERARHAILLPGLAMRNDTLAAFAAPLERWHALRKFRPGFLAAVGDYPGREETMPALAFDAQHAVVDWGATPAPQRALVEGHLAQLATPDDAAIAAANGAYLRHWFAALAQLAAANDATLILFPLPRGPYHALQPAHPAAPLVPAAVAAEPNAVVLPATLLDALEQPQFFFDVLHLNRAGRAAMSATLGAEVRARLAAEPPR